MENIGIITLYGNTNYGNRLQNLAVQTILEDYGFRTESIVFVSSRFKWRTFPLRKHMRGIFLKDSGSLRKYRLEKFNRRYIKTRYIYGQDDHLPSKLVSEYDFFVTGSDQVWNVRMKEVIRKDWFYFLEFAEDAKKVCISPSIGASLHTVPEESLERMRRLLSGFRNLCCREKQGAQEISDLTGRMCEWLIDPTLYISPERWKKILSLKSSGRVPYVFLFFLDGISKELRDYIGAYAASGGYEIIDPSDPGSRFYGIDPADFVSFISGAHMVFTDSFHATAFCVNFQVPFYVFDRNLVQNMSSRIQSVCEVFGLKDRYIREQKPFEIREDCSFEAADGQLAAERRKLSGYLDRCFGK